MKRDSMESEALQRCADGRWAKRLAVGWFAGAAGAMGAVVLAAVGLVGVLPVNLAAISSIILGASLLCEGTGLAACFARLAGRPVEGQWFEWAGTIGAKLLGGLGGILIGVLVLQGAEPTLLALSVLFFGASFVFTSIVSAVPNLQEIAGAVAYALGLLAVSGLHLLILVPVAFLSLGLIALYNGAANPKRLGRPVRDPTGELKLVVGSSQIAAAGETPIPSR